MEIDGVDRGSRTVKIESTLTELEHLLKMNNDPIEFMCQVITKNVKEEEKHTLLLHVENSIENIIIIVSI